MPRFGSASAWLRLDGECLHVGRIWREHGLKPRRAKTPKFSNDKRFGEKFGEY